MTRPTAPEPFDEFIDESGDRSPELAAINADPRRRARYEAFYREGEIALAVYALRDALGLTQEDFAAAAQMSQENLSRIERATDVKFSTISRLARAGGAHLQLSAVLGSGKRVDLLRPPEAGGRQTTFAARSGRVVSR
jgi:DNA-binding XRE family transcriptional regulator